MKGAAFELDRAFEALEQADFGNATRLIRRAISLLEPPIELLHLSLIHISMSAVSASSRFA